MRGSPRFLFVCQAAGSVTVRPAADYRSEDAMTLRIGRIAYLNVAPYFHYLREEGFTGEVVAGVPSALNAMLAEGSIDACPSSSYEYGLHAADYYLLPGHSISSIGPVHSVLLFTPGPLQALSGAEICVSR